MSPPVEISASVDGKVINLEASYLIPIICAPNSRRHLKFVVVNRSNERVVFSSYEHSYRTKYKKVDIAMKDQHRVGKGAIYAMKPSDSCWVTMDLVARESCGLRITLMFILKQADGNTLKIARDIIYDCISEDAQSQGLFNMLAPNPEAPVVDEAGDEIYADLELVEFEGYASNCALEHTLDLDQYDLEEYVIKLVYAPHTPDKLDNIRETLNIRNLSFGNYSEFFNHLLDLEEIQHWKDIKHYTIRNCTVARDRKTDNRGNTRFRLRVPGLAEKRPSVLRGDRLYVIPLPPNGYKYEGMVNDTSQNDAYLVFNPRFEEDVDTDDLRNIEFRIEFNIDRLSLRLMHRAVEIVKTAEYFEDVLFPIPFHVKPIKDPETLQLDCFESRVEENVEQLTAIKHIVAGTSRPAPYLIYGPPGTGKTFTLVEAIKQICKNYPKSKILVCAPQNDAADLIAERLLDHVHPKCIMRFNAASRSYDSLSDLIKDIANYSQVEDHVYYPPKDELARKQIIVSTLVTSGRLVSAEMTDHFTHIFIDEAGHATEPETVIPVGLLSKGGQLVVAGDPKQLGPIIRSDLAIGHGLGKSLLERLMDLETGVYSRGEGENSTYDKNFVTKLLKNFRSHPQILEVPNQRFYEFELQPCADREEREKFCGWKHLHFFSLDRWMENQIGFPLIFRQVEGREEQERSSPSWFNRHEVLVVTEYVQLLLFGSDPYIQATDIGIISPYIQQVRKIRQALKAIDGLDKVADVRDIKVGSVEKFQGDERDVIIISTVRSQSNKLAQDKKFNLGFVSNSKRFNVAVTRAKSLLIVIGNPTVLCTDENWRRLVEHIVNGGGYIGDELSEDLLRIEEDDGLAEDMNEMALNDLNADTGGKSNHLLHRDDEYVSKE